MAQIKAIKENGNLIYPATIGEAVVVTKENKKLSDVVDELKTTGTANTTAINDETTRAKAAEAANAKAVSDETTRAKQAEQANADAIKAVKETADSTKSITDAYFTEKKEFLDVIREEDVVAIYKDKTINTTTNKLEDADDGGVIIIKLRGNGKLVTGTQLTFRAFDSLEPDGTLLNGEWMESVPGTGKFAYLAIRDTNNHNYVAIRSTVSLYVSYYDWQLYTFFVVEMTQYEYDSLAPKDDAEIVPHLIDWQVNGSYIYPNSITKTQYKYSGWTGMNGTNARHLSLLFDNTTNTTDNRALCVSYNPRLETLDVRGATLNFQFFYLVGNPSLEYVRFFAAVSSQFRHACFRCTRLKTIYFDNIDFGGVTLFVGEWEAFSWGCYSLTTILGSVSNIKVNISFKDSPLTRNSALVIINGLADLTGSDTQTVTFSSTTKALLTEEDKNLITSKNWTLA